MRTVDQLIEQHEQFKQKGLRLGEQDMYDWIMLYEDMLDMATNKSSEYYEAKQQNEVEEGLRFIELQNENKEDGKKKYTVDSVKAALSQEFFDKRQELKASKLISELLGNKCKVIMEYINVVKLYMKK